MYKKIIFSLMLVIFLSSQNISFAQNTPPPPPPIPQMGAQVDQVPEFPPIILISGRERESAQKVFVDKVKVGTPINVKLLTFDRDPKEVLKVNSYGLPSSAKLEIKKDAKLTNRVEAELNWTPTNSDKGFRTIIIEAANSKGKAGRVSLSYDVN